MIDALGALAARLVIWLVGVRSVYVECERHYAATAARETVMLAVVNQGPSQQRGADEGKQSVASAIGFAIPEDGGG